jgi:hypothetical protein
MQAAIKIESVNKGCRGNRTSSLRHFQTDPALGST